MLQSSTSRTKKWIMNVAVMNQFFETREMNVAVINQFFETRETLKQEKWMLQSSIDSWKQRNWNLNAAVINWLFFEPKIWNWTLQSTIIWNHTACACNCQLVSESGKLNNYTLITNYCLLSADIELALNVSTYAGQRSPQLVMTSGMKHTKRTGMFT